MELCHRAGGSYFDAYVLDAGGVAYLDGDVDPSWIFLNWGWNAQYLDVRGPVGPHNGAADLDGDVRR